MATKCCLAKERSQILDFTLTQLAGGGKPADTVLHHQRVLLNLGILLQLWDKSFVGQCLEPFV